MNAPFHRSASQTIDHIILFKLLIRISSPWCGIAPCRADQLKRRRVDQGANGNPHTLATSPHKSSPCCRGWSPRADPIVTNTTLPVVYRSAIPRRRVPATLSINSANPAIPRIWLLHQPPNRAPMLILASIGCGATDPRPTAPIPDRRHGVLQVPAKDLVTTLD